MTSRVGLAILVAISVVAGGCAAHGDGARSAAGATSSPESGVVSGDKFRLRYRIEGQGNPTIVVGDAVAHPRLFSSRLRGRLRLVFLDHRVFSPPTGPVEDRDFALTLILDDIERARRQLQLGCIVVMGHSGNALIALEYAKKYPAAVSHVVMIATSPNLGAAHSAAAEQYWNQRATEERKAILAENLRLVPDEAIARLPVSERFAAAYRRNAPRVWHDPNFDASPLLAGFALNVRGFGHIWGRELAQLDITSGFTQFPKPVFLALGQSDFGIAPASSWDDVKPWFRDLTMRVFANSGHFPQFEEHEAFDGELLRWLGTRRPQSDAPGCEPSGK